MVRSRRVFRLDFPGVSRHQSLELKKRGTNNISECKIFDARSFWCGSRPRFDSIVSIAVRWTFPALSVIRFTEVCVENIRPPQIMRFRDAIHHSGRKPINRDLIPYRELHFLTPFVLFSIRPLRLFTPFSTLFVLSLSLSLSLSNSGESSYCRWTANSPWESFLIKDIRSFGFDFFWIVVLGNAMLASLEDGRLEDCNSKWLKIWSIY